MSDKKKSTPDGLRQKPSSTYAERYAAGKALRDACPRKIHVGWRASKNRRDPDRNDIGFRGFPELYRCAMGAWFGPRSHSIEAQL